MCIRDRLKPYHYTLVGVESDLDLMLSLIHIKVLWFEQIFSRQVKVSEGMAGSRKREKIFFLVLSCSLAL